MGSVKVTVYGRAKPCPKSLQCKEYRIKTGGNEDYITFTQSKPIQAKKSYRFRKIFNEHATQEEVFEVVANPIIESVLSGYNGTIFTYGQTGSGKTYTMTGDIEQWIYPGLIPRTIQRIFQLKDKDVTVSVTYCEIYNEHVYDLIRSEKMESEFPNVNILEDSSGMTHFRNLSVHIVNTAYEAIQLLIRGDANKMVAETTSNAKSSRSHVLFSLTLEVPHPNQEKYMIKPVLYLVDLAGSEKLSKCKTQMSNPLETRYINLSLHYLEQVLLALRQPGRVHIPYRNSLMTALLRNSLGGNCITAMIATFSLAAEDTEETVQTCRFAERIALIKNEVKLSDSLNPEKEIEELRKENKRLKSQIKLMGGQPENEELNEEEKEKCAESVQCFIESSMVDTLPLTDLKRMEYCLRLMRDEIVKKPQLSENQSENVIEFFQNCRSVNTSNTEFQRSLALNVYKSEKNLKKKRNTITLPKVNITYKNWESVEKLTVNSVKGATCGLKKENTCENQEKKTPPLSIGRISSCTSTSRQDIKGTTKELRKVEDKLRFMPVQENVLKLNQTNTTSEEEFKPQGNAGLSHDWYDYDIDEEAEEDEEEEIDSKVVDREEEIEHQVERDGKGEYNDLKKQISFETFKRVISVGVQIDNNVEVESEEETELRTMERAEGSLSVGSGEGNHFSWSYLPLTGDIEVDEEILKFYKARYNIFNRQEK